MKKEHGTLGIKRIKKMLMLDLLLILLETHHSRVPVT